MNGIILLLKHRGEEKTYRLFHDRGKVDMFSLAKFGERRIKYGGEWEEIFNKY